MKQEIHRAGGSQIYREIARRTAVFVAEKAEDFSAKFPNIVIQNT